MFNITTGQWAFSFHYLRLLDCHIPELAQHLPFAHFPFTGTVCPPLFVILVLMFCMVTLLFILAVPFVGPPPPCLWCIPISIGHRKRVLGQMLFLKETISVGILALNIALNSGKQLSFTTITYKCPWDPCAIHCPHLLLLDTRFYSSSPHNVFLLVHGFLHISYTDRTDICLTS